MIERHRWERERKRVEVHSLWCLHQGEISQIFIKVQSFFHNHILQLLNDEGDLSNQTIVDHSRSAPLNTTDHCLTVDPSQSTRNKPTTWQLKVIEVLIPDQSLCYLTWPTAGVWTPCILTIRNSFVRSRLNFCGSMWSCCSEFVPRALSWRRRSQETKWSV